MSTKKQSWIPKISNAKLSKLAARIRPVVRGHYIEQVDLRTVAYTWDPKRTEKAKGLKKICDIRTYHTYGYYGMFKPSIAEVIAQIPENQLADVVAFEIIKSPETADDLNAERMALNAGYHVATTRLYATA